MTIKMYVCACAKYTTKIAVSCVPRPSVPISSSSSSSSFRSRAFSFKPHPSLRSRGRLLSLAKTEYGPSFDDDDDDNDDHITERKFELFS